MWPTEPFLSVATVAFTDADLGNIPQRTDLAHVPLIFREDYYDPVTRLRRGRFYVRNDSQPSEWLVPPHPALPDESRRVDHDGRVRKTLFTFHDWPARLKIPAHAVHATVVLGVIHAATFWKIIAIEQISTGEDLVSLKSRSNMGVLPELAEDAIPPPHRRKISQFVERLVDTAYRGGAEAVIDRCRDAASAILGAFFDAPDKDLGTLAEVAFAQKRKLLSNTAKILCVLHARAKPSEQSKRSVGHPTEDDAAFALECAASIIREVGWSSDASQLIPADVD
jgi:hypothetical protein